MVTKAQVYRHLKPVGDDLGVIEASRVLEVEVIVGRRIIVEVIADQKHLLDGRMKRVDQVARRDEPRSREQNALVVLHTILAAFDVKVVDNMRISDKCEVELVRRGVGLLGPEALREKAAEGGNSQCGELATV